MENGKRRWPFDSKRTRKVIDDWGANVQGFGIKELTIDFSICIHLEISCLHTLGLLASKLLVKFIYYKFFNNFNYSNLKKFLKIVKLYISKYLKIYVL